MEQVPLNQRDIILVPFPFSDQTSKKVRPGLVVSNNRFNACSEDVILCAITTNLARDGYTVPLLEEELAEKRILDPCCIKVENILKIDKKLVIKKLDSISERLFLEVKAKLGLLF